MSKIKPILFSTSMVQAILEGRKTQTRRVVKHNIMEEYSRLPKGSLETFSVYDKKGAQYWLDYENQPASLADGFCPYGKQGDVLWVRESWNRPECACYDNCVCPPFIYKADQEWGKEFKWKPSIHMPKDAARIFLRITDIRVERLQDITEEDARAEGVKSKIYDGCGVYECYATGEWQMSAKSSFATLWQSINDPESWAANPFVWVVSFERIDKPE